MNDYLIIKLKNNKELIIIDRIKYSNQIYFLCIDKTKNSESVFEIFKYNEKTNNLMIIEDMQEHDVVLLIFKERQEKHSKKITFLQKLTKMRIVSINNTNYTLENEQGMEVIKTIIFKTSKMPKINDYIYISKSILKETNIFEYGEIYNFSNMDENEIIKVESNNYEYFLQRYYG